VFTVHRDVHYSWLTTPTHADTLGQAPVSAVSRVVPLTTAR